MYINQFFKTKSPVVSFEIFPPKQTSAFESIATTTKELAALQPDFISITYGAGGSTRSNTLEVAEYIKKEHNIETLAHLTCIADTPADIGIILDELQSRGIKNILALRGDLPQEAPTPTTPVYAKHLIEQIKKRDTFCIAAAAYPEGHTECTDMERDILHLAQKVEAGADFLITQIFFDNTLLYAFQEKIVKRQLKTNLSAGIMPVFSKSQIERICSLCGASVPVSLQQMLDKYGDKPPELEKAGIEFACEQIVDLCQNQVQGLHIYTMNKPHLAQALVRNTGLRARS